MLSKGNQTPQKVNTYCVISLIELEKIETTVNKSQMSQRLSGD